MDNALQTTTSFSFTLSYIPRLPSTLTRTLRMNISSVLRVYERKIFYGGERKSRKSIKKRSQIAEKERLEAGGQLFEKSGLRPDRSIYSEHVTQISNFSQTANVWFN
jgi:hypothetical protein